MKKFTLLLSAMLFSMMSFAGLGTGYTKVTNISTLSAGDKVVLYCDDAELGITGWDGNKTGTAGASGWVEYVVEAADGGVLLKDGTQYISLTVKNTFKYNATGSVCKVTADGILCITLDGADYMLYENANNGSPLYRMYVDKSGNSQYKPFYVYQVGEGGNTDNPGTDNPGNNDDPVTPEVDTDIKGLVYADAYYYEFEGVAYYDIDMYKDVDPDTYEYTYPEVYVSVEAKSKTALNGTYDVLYAGYWRSANDSVEINETTPGTVTIKNTDNEGNYSISGSFVGTDGKTYTFNDVVSVWAFDYDNFEEITLSEGGNDNPGGDDNQGDDDPVIPSTPSGEVTFDADVDKGNASLDAANQTPYSVSKDGVTLEVTKGIIGTYNNENHYRIYKNETLTITSTVGTIVGVEFTCTANDDTKYGPGCLTWSTGDYTYSGAVGTWTGSATSVEFVASTNQVRATQILVKLATATGVEDVTIVEVPVKVFQNGQLMIIRGENQYNAAGVQVK